MSRFSKFTIGLMSFGFVVGLAGAVGQAEEAAVRDIGSRRELFVDRYLIDRLEGTRLELCEPKPAEAVLKCDRPWEGISTIGGHVIKIGQTYRMNYMARTKADDVLLDCLAESQDGIHWTKPNLGLVEVAGSRENNVLGMRLRKSHVIIVRDPYPGFGFIDTRAGVPPSERYKAITVTSGPDEKWKEEPHRYICNDPFKHLWVWVSADRLKWKLLHDQPVSTVGRLSNAFDAGQVCFWSESEQRYICYTRYVGKGFYRLVARTTSPDLLHWSKPVKMKFGDYGLVPPEQLYYTTTEPYFRAPHIYIALAPRFMHKRRVLTDEQCVAIGISPGEWLANDCTDTVLMTSRGGDLFDRTFMEAFVRPGIGLANWTSRTNFPLHGVVQTGPTEMSIYVNRHYAHKSWHIQRMTLRLDGFASVHGPYAGGEMVTKPLKFKGKQLEINYSTSAAGSVRVEIQDADGKPIPDFALEDCPEIIGDQIERTVSWKQGSDVGALAGKPIRLRFVLKDADLYSLRFQ